MIGFNKPHLTGNEVNYILDAIRLEKISGNGQFTQKAQQLIEKRYNIKKALLTTSCTDALEMCALLIDTQPHDEIIIPSYTFVSTANAFILRGAKIIFADSSAENPNIDPEQIESLISAKTKAIVVVHYAGISCEMDKILMLANKYNLYVIEDAAQGIEASYKNRFLGSLGHLACFSFHDTKNITSGEGGALLINDDQFIQRAEILWEKGTNRSSFARGEIDKYNWVDIGSSFLPSEINAAFLFAQLENIEEIQKKRHCHWNKYYEGLKILEAKSKIKLPFVPDQTHHNAHIFYLVCRTREERNELIKYLNEKGIQAIFHYLSLHKSPYYLSKYNGGSLINCEHYTENLLRLPLYYDLPEKDIDYVINCIHSFFNAM